MARLILMVMIPIMVIGLLVGCGEKEEAANNKFGFLPVEKIEVKVNKEFTIARGFDLNSGYIWREKYDESMLELLKNEVDAETKEDGTIVLYQVFHFKGRQKGNTQILLAHVRSSLGGNEVRTQEVFDIVIK
ncbi:MAG TPA: protease inhibitor I42 family protein [Dehalococcoidales bacterium]|nr:protease inhibitor I42 family protein [Dehalococcoidales bacterium]